MLGPLDERDRKRSFHALQWNLIVNTEMTIMFHNNIHDHARH